MSKTMRNLDRTRRLVDYLIARGDRAFALRSLKSATAYYDRALDLEPAYAPALCRVASMKSTSGQGLEARELYARAVSVANTAEWRANALIGVGSAHLDLGDLTAANEAYGEVLKLDFSTEIQADRDWIVAHALCGLGAVEGRRGNSRAALNKYKEALHHAPEHVPSMANLASAYADMGNYTDALPALKEAIRLSDDPKELLMDLGDLYTEIGETHLARDAYSEALAAGHSRAKGELESLPKADTT